MVFFGGGTKISIICNLYFVIKAGADAGFNNATKYF